MGKQDEAEPDEENKEPESDGTENVTPAEEPQQGDGGDIFNMFDDVQAESEAPADAPTEATEEAGEPKEEEPAKPAEDTQVPEPGEKEEGQGEAVEVVAEEPKPAPPKKAPPPPPPPPPKAKPEKPPPEKKEKKAEKAPKEKKEKAPKKEKGEPSDEPKEKKGKGKKGKEPSEVDLKVKSSVRFDKMGLFVGRKSETSEGESYSSSEEEEEQKEKKEKSQKVTVPAEDKPRKGKGKKEPKGKKGKKKEEVEEPVVEPEPEPEEDDFLANLRKMKAAAAAAAVAQEEEVAEAGEKPKAKKEKKPPKKKLSKKEKEKMAEMMEQLKKEAELEAIRQAELERIRIEEEKKAAIEKEKREIYEQQFRLEQLEKTFAQMEEAKNCFKKLAKEERAILEWQLYIACGELPDPSIINRMSTYLHLWEKACENVTIDDISKRTSDVLKLLRDVDDLLDCSPEEDVDKEKIENWKWIHQLFRALQRNTLDVVTYKLLRCVEFNLHRIDIPTADFDFTDHNIKYSLWLKVQLPTPLPNPRRPPKSRLDVDFPNVLMHVLFPMTIDCENMAIRAMYLKYDHVSDLSPTFYMPDLPWQLRQNVAEASKIEWRTKLQYKFDQRDIVEKKPGEEKPEEPVKKNVEENEEEEEVVEEDEIPIVPYKKLEPTASDVAVAYEDLAYMDTRKKIELQLAPYVLNLRKYIILGGVFVLDLLYQPPQPQDFVTMDMNITRLFIPKKLEYVPFYSPYTPPEPPESGEVRAPEVIEEEMKKHEEEMDKLMLVTLTWPTYPIFIELPLVYHWDEEEKLWTKKDVHDLKHNEEKGTLSFRTGAFGIFGLAALRFTNLPFQAWELKPELDGSITFQITAAIVLIEFNVKEGLVCMTLLKNCPSTALKRLLGVYFKLYKLKRILKETGIDIFPENDSVCYIEGNCEKHWPMERHLYRNMAAISNCFSFLWSRWNLTAGRRNIIMQMRENLPDKIKQKNYSMLLVTPLKATFVDCTESSQIFCDDDVEGLKFSADLWNLLKISTSITTRKKILSAPQEVVYVLSQLLISTRVLSFS